ncbi:MAG: hypothetical protein WED11_06535 [Natronospirillum sp.]
MTAFPSVLPHGAIEQVFEDVFMVTGAMQGEFSGSQWQFSRNMTVVRDGNALTLLNTVRLDETGLAALEALGEVRHVARIGALHGRDDAFYLQRYPEALYWAMPEMEHPDGLTVNQLLEPGGKMPFASASLFAFEQTKLPEGIIRLDREGGILIACDALQNWLSEDEFFSAETCCTMREMGFFQTANLGPVWVQVNEPQADDFARLQEWPFRHVICGHGVPLRDGAREAFAERIHQHFSL